MEPMTPSDLMMKDKLSQPAMRFPSKDIQQFILQIIDQSNFPGQIAEFVSSVKSQIRTAEVSE